MHLSRLGLNDFRSYAELDLALEAGVAVLLGPNGRGKTNLVEAVGYLATLDSHRVATDAALVRAGADRAVVRGRVEQAGRSTVIEVEITPGRANRARVNGAPQPRPREVLGLLRTVLFAPEDLALVKGEPAARRRFLDDLLVARTPRLAGVRADYERVLRQRTTLLRSAAATRRGKVAGELPTLDVWDEHLVVLGAELVAARLALLAELRDPVAAAYEVLAGQPGSAALAYQSSLVADGDPPLVEGADRASLATTMRERLAVVRAAELDRGVSLVGPHRDELVLSLGGLPARGYASHGESWSLALALRLASYDLLAGDGAEPVLLLDDVFAELDTGRRGRLAERVAGAEQVLVTAAVAEDVPVALDGLRLRVEAGEVHRD